MAPAARLGLKSWDLFLNLGLAYLGQHEFDRAAKAFKTAVALAPQHPEAHFNLGIADERTNRLDAALQEIEIALNPAPRDPDVVNTNAIICAETGDTVHVQDRFARGFPGLCSRSRQPRDPESLDRAQPSS